MSTMAKTLLHIGFSKSGSSFLQEWFDQHPGTNYTYVEFDNTGQIQNIVKPNLQNSCSDNNNISVFSREEIISFPDDVNRKLVNSYLRRNQPYEIDNYIYEKKQLQNQACCFLYNKLPCSKILIVTRSFLSLISSLYSEIVKAGFPIKFEDYLSRIKKLLLANYDYNYLIDLYVEKFNKENVIVLPYELLRDDQNNFISIIEKSLNINHYDIEIGKVNPSLSKEELFWYPVISNMILSLSRKRELIYRSNFYKKYKTYLMRNRLKPVAKFLSQLVPSSRKSNQIPNGYLDEFKGKADILKNYPHYENYFGEYLIDHN